MRRQLSVLRWVAMAVLMVAACKEDPTSSLLNGFSRLELEFSYREVVIGDSVFTYVIERDDQGNPLPPTASVTSGCTGGVASVGSANAAPQLRTAFYVKGLTYGVSCVVASAGGRVDTMQIATFPLGVRVTGQDTVVSGTSGQYTHTYFDARFLTVTGVPNPTWTTTDANKATVTATGLTSGFDPGPVTVRTTGPGSPAGGVVGNKIVFVDPRAFTGTVAGAFSGGLPGDTVIFVVGGAARKFNQIGADSINLMGAVPAGAVNPSFNFTFVPTFITRLTPDSAYVIVPPTGKAGAMDLVLSRRDSSKVAEKATFTSPSAAAYDPYDPADDAPGGGFTITQDGEYFVTLSGQCVQGVAAAPGADCDDFITFTNSLARPDTLQIAVQWVPAGADIDLITCSATCGSPFNFSGATGANPERISPPGLIVPASTTRMIYLNNWENTGVPRQLVRIRVKGIG